jgi:carbon storage regulator
MLVLSRKFNEKIMIGDMIEISVLELSKDRVKIGVSAPKEITVHRKEVYDLVHQGNIRASSVAADDIDALQQLINQSRRL